MTIAMKYHHLADDTVTHPSPCDPPKLHYAEKLRKRGCTARTTTAHERQSCARTGVGIADFGNKCFVRFLAGSG